MANAVSSPITTSPFHLKYQRKSSYIHELLPFTASSFPAKGRAVSNWSLSPCGLVTNRLGFGSIISKGFMRDVLFIMELLKKAVSLRWSYGRQASGVLGALSSSRVPSTLRATSLLRPSGYEGWKPLRPCWTAFSNSSIMALVFLLAGCALGPDYERPVVDDPEAFRAQLGPGADTVSLADLGWWDLYQDAHLKTLIR